MLNGDIQTQKRNPPVAMAGGVVSTSLASGSRCLLVSNFQEAKEAREEPPAREKQNSLVLLFGAAMIIRKTKKTYT